MKRMGYILIACIAMVVLAGIWLSVLSQNGVAAGLQAGKLTLCQNGGNCVCSEYSDSPGYVSALNFQGDKHAAWEKAKMAVQATGGKAVSVSDDYIAAIYTSRFFRFVDDLELRLDSAAQRIQIRSASRVGRSDFGVNARRVEQLRKYFIAE